MTFFPRNFSKKFFWDFYFQYFWLLKFAFFFSTLRKISNNFGQYLYDHRSNLSQSSCEYTHSFLTVTDAWELDILWSGFSTISHFLKRILPEHEKLICGLELKLFMSFCSIRVHSREWENFKKTQKLNSSLSVHKFLSKKILSKARTTNLNFYQTACSIIRYQQFTTWHTSQL